MTQGDADWHGHGFLGEGWAVYAGRAGDNRRHAHHALQLAVGIGAPVRAVLAGAGRVEAPGLLIAADVPHALASGEAVRLLFVDRESEAGRRLGSACPAGYRVLDAAECQRLLAVWPGPAHGVSPLALTPLLEALAGRDAPGAPDRPTGSASRVRELIEGMPARATLALDQAQLAAEVALSTDRFSHVFRVVAGMPLRPYLRWLRLRRALALAVAGHTLTEAAHAAGFADAAHLSRTMRRHFGVTPTTLLGAMRKP